MDLQPPVAAPANPADNDPLAAALEALRAEAAPPHSRLNEAAADMTGGRFQAAHDRLKQYLARRPHDKYALNLLGETLMHLDRDEEAKAALTQCVALAPDFAVARCHLAHVLVRLSETPAALRELAILIENDPGNPLLRQRWLAALVAQGDHDAAADYSRALIHDFPAVTEFWIGHGRALQVIGDREGSIAAYRKAAELRPALGEAYWSLAGLKTFRFSSADIEKMEIQLKAAGVGGEDRIFLHFALGKAYADLGAHAKAFDNYARGNALARMSVTYDPDTTSAYVARCREVFTPELFASRADAGSPVPGPIFILGMPRSGSTLVAQILASHPAIEAAGELTAVTLVAMHLELAVAPERNTDYPGVLASLDANALRELGERYLETSRFARKLKRRFFIDKMPNNFPHLGLICLMLPNAKIVDVRRHPMACCFSNFTHCFGNGQRYTYRQSDLGRAWRDYVALMAHFDDVLPGRVHRVQYERLVASPEAEVRQLLDYLGLPFEPACLRFYENRRPVATVSSEQVRTPIFEDGLNRWRDYELWLGPLKAALGPALEAYSPGSG